MTDAPDSHAMNASIAKLAGDVYEAAPLEERRKMLDHLLRPLGILSLLGVAHGVFAKIQFRRAMQDMPIRVEDLACIQTRDVVALVDYVQQASIEVVDLLAKLISASPLMAGSSAAALLVTMLVRRTQGQRSDVVELVN